MANVALTVGGGLTIAANGAISLGGTSASVNSLLANSVTSNALTVAGPLSVASLLANSVTSNALNIAGPANVGALSATSFTLAGSVGLGAITANGLQVVGSTAPIELAGVGGTNSVFNIDWSTYGVNYASNNLPAWRWQMVDSGVYTDSLNLQQSTGANTSTSRMYMTTGGLTGFGTTTPGQILDVVGNVRASNSLLANGAIVSGTATVSGPLFAGSAANIAGVLSMNNQIQNQVISMFTNEPTVNTASTNYFGFGVNNYTMRYQVPGQSFHTWFANTVPVMNLSPALLTVAGGVSAASGNITGTMTANALVTGGAGLLVQSAAAASPPTITLYNTQNNNGNISVGGNAASLAGGAFWTDDGSYSTNFSLNSRIPGNITNTMSSRLTVLSGGNVGVNTTTPAYTFDVNGTGRIGATAFYASGGAFWLYNSALPVGNSFSMYGGAAGQTVLNSAPGQSLSFKINNTEYLTLSSTGNVGFGTTTPQYTADVNGPARISGGLSCNNQSQNQIICLYSGDTNGALIANSTNYLGFGVNTYTLRYQVPAGQYHTWYAGNTQVMNLTSTGLSVPTSVMLGQGSTFSPSLAFTNQTNTGLYQPVTNATGFVINGVENMRLTNTGLGVGTVTPASTLQVVGTSLFSSNATGATVFGAAAAIPGNANAPTQFYGVANARTCISTYMASNSSQNHIEFFTTQQTGAIGYINTTGTSTTFGTASDRRLKRDIRALSGASTLVSKLRAVEFGFKTEDPSERYEGFIADEVGELVPRAVRGTKDAVDSNGAPVYQGVDAGRLVPWLVAALQETMAEVAELRRRVLT